MKLKFVNSKGAVVRLDEKLTVDDLVKLGIEIYLEPEETPKNPDPRIFIHTPEKTRARNFKKRKNHE